MIGPVLNHDEQGCSVKCSALSSCPMIDRMVMEIFEDDDRLNRSPEKQTTMHLLAESTNQNHVEVKIPKETCQWLAQNQDHLMVRCLSNNAVELLEHRWSLSEIENINNFQPISDGRVTNLEIIVIIIGILFALSIGVNIYLFISKFARGSTHDEQNPRETEMQLTKHRQTAAPPSLSSSEDGGTYINPSESFNEDFYVDATTMQKLNGNKSTDDDDSISSSSDEEQVDDDDDIDNQSGIYVEPLERSEDM